MKQRVNKVIFVGTALLLGGLIYAWICHLLGFGLPCLFRVMTGWQCPGCGVSRMCICLLKGDVQGAFAANGVLLFALPGLIAVIVDSTVRYIREGCWRTKGWSTVLVWILTVALLAFGIVRNL